MATATYYPERLMRTKRSVLQRRSVLMREVHKLDLLLQIIDLKIKAAYQAEATEHTSITPLGGQGYIL